MTLLDFWRAKCCLLWSFCAARTGLCIIEWSGSISFLLAVAVCKQYQSRECYGNAAMGHSFGPPIQKPCIQNLSHLLDTKRVQGREKHWISEDLILSSFDNFDRVEKVADLDHDQSTKYKGKKEIWYIGIYFDIWASISTALAVLFTLVDSGI